MYFDKHCCYSYSKSLYTFLDTLYNMHIYMCIIYLISITYIYVYIYMQYLCIYMYMYIISDSVTQIICLNPVYSVTDIFSKYTILKCCCSHVWLYDYSNLETFLIIGQHCGSGIKHVTALVLYLVP